VNNGQRFSTYVIPGAAGSGTVQLNGAAARLGLPGDLVILIAYGEFEESEVAGHRPSVVFVDGSNHPVRATLSVESCQVSALAAAHPSPGGLPPWAVVTQARQDHIRRVVELLHRWSLDPKLPCNEASRWCRAGWLHDALRDADE